MGLRRKQRLKELRLLSDAYRENTEAIRDLTAARRELRELQAGPTCSWCLTGSGTCICQPSCHASICRGYRNPPP
jgi:hypothetical protein